MIRHSVHSIKYSSMMDNVAMHIGIQLTLMFLVNGLGAAIGAEYDVINKIGVTHNVAKVHITNEIYKCVLGVAFSDILLYGLTRGDASSLAPLDCQALPRVTQRLARWARTALNQVT